MPRHEPIESHFNSIGDYSTVSDKVVPFNKEMHTSVISEVSKNKRKELRVLDLGCGEGNAIKSILEKFPLAQATGIDLSEKMLEQAEERLKKFGKRANVKRGDFTVDGFGAGLDFILSEIAIHNCSHGEKKKLFKKIFLSLSENGVFINSDFLAGESETDESENKKNYSEFLRKNLSGGELIVWERHAFKEDTPAKLSDQFKWLKEAGFSKIKVIWKKANLAIYVAYK
ncbi:MAG: class I SAM-dependent methyltransferase [Candidatus Micrarchaeota archaeon]